MKLKEFKQGDIVHVTIDSALDGEGVVKQAEETKLIIEWVVVTTCYACQSVTSSEIEITQELVDAGVVNTLVLIERKRETENTWYLTEEKMNNLKGSYESNKDDLKKIRKIIKETGCTGEGLFDAAESFEQGWNNALEFVFRELNIPFQ